MALFLAAVSAGATRSAVDERRHDRAGRDRARGDLLVAEHEATERRRDAEEQLARRDATCRRSRPDVELHAAEPAELLAARPGRRGPSTTVPVGRADRPPSRCRGPGDRTPRARAPAVIRVERGDARREQRGRDHRLDRIIRNQGRPEESRGRALRVDAERLGRHEEALVAGAEHLLGLASPDDRLAAARNEARDHRQHVLLLLLGGHRPDHHVLARRIADLGLADALGEHLAHRLEAIAVDEHAADGGALLAGLLGHVARHVLDEQVERLAAALHVGAEERRR